MSTPEELQAQAKSEYAEIIKRKGAVGQFKQILPMTDDIALAIVRASSGPQAKEDLEHEVALLKVLQEHGYPALQTYGEVFEVADGKHAVVMDWVPNANLIDGKSPEMINYLLPALMLGVPINTSNEAWAMQLPQMMRNMQLAAKNCNFDEVQAFARNVSREIAQLQKIIEEQKLIIGDLQMLITPQGKITIIDPLDVLRMVPKDPPGQGFDFVDVMDPSKPNSKEFIQSLFKSMAMLENMKMICDGVATLKDKQMFEMLISSMASSLSPSRPGSRVSSAPSSPVMPRAVVTRRTQSAPNSPPDSPPAEFKKPIAPAPVARKPESKEPTAKENAPGFKAPAPKKRAVAITPAAVRLKEEDVSSSPLKKRVAKKLPPAEDPAVSQKSPERPKPKSH